MICLRLLWKLLYKIFNKIVPCLAAGVAERFVKNLGQSEQADCSAVQLLSAKFVYIRIWREIQTPNIYDQVKSHTGYSFDCAIFYMNCFVSS